MKQIAHHNDREALLEGERPDEFRLRIFERDQCILDRCWADPFEPRRFAEAEFGFPMFGWRGAFTHPDAPGWQFGAIERSPEVWDIEARDSAGRSVSRVGIGYESVLRDCIADAQSMSARYSSN